MFKNVGKKIKAISVLLLIAGILLSLYIGVFGHILSGGEVSADADEMILGVVIIVVGIIASVLASLLVNGFGVIVENAEKVEDIHNLLLEINNKKTDFRGADSKKNVSILNSSFNNEVFDEREFSAEEPAAPEYVNPVSGHEVASAQYIAPTYAGKGKEHPTKPVFETQEVGVEPMSDPEPVEVPKMPEMPVRNNRPTGPVRPGRSMINNNTKREPVYDAPVQRRTPVYDEPITSAFDEPVYEAPKPQTLAYDAPAPAYDEPVYESPKPQTPVYDEPVYESPKPQAPVYDEPVYESPKPQAPVYDEPVYESPKPQAPVYDEPVYESPKPQAPVYDEPVYESPKPQAPVYDEPVYEAPQPKAATQPRATFHRFIEPARDAQGTNDEPGVYESPEVPKPKVRTPEEQARANQIQELIFKFVARRNGKVNINDILRTVPRNVEPSEFHDAVKVLEEQGKLVKNEVGDFTAIK